MSKYLRQVDNIAKIFSLEDNKYNNTFRFTISLKDNVKPKILTIAIKKSCGNL